jgi:hypothetical protein
MELLIPGLILVALMAWASTKIKKRAADAFEAETVETDDYVIRKPEGFLHVIGATDHELSAYSRELAEGDDAKMRRATIEIDVLPATELSVAADAIRSASSDAEILVSSDKLYELRADETANGTAFTAFYKLVRNETSLYRLRFAVASESLEEYSDRVRSTLDGFELK